jgi:hypothetical protein
MRTALRFFLFLCLLVVARASDAQQASVDPDAAAREEQLNSISVEDRKKVMDSIMSAPNPQQALQQVAEQAQMQPEELLNFLQPGSSEGITIASVPSSRKSLIGSLGVMLLHAASRHPKMVTLVVMCLIFTAMVAVNAPRTGFVISSRRGMFSRGPSTLWNPPTRYLQKRILQQQDTPLGIESQHSWKGVLPLLDEKDGTNWHTIRRQKKSLIQQAASSQLTLSMAEFLEEERENEYDAIMEVLLEHAADLLIARQLTEFVKPDRSLRLVTTTEDEDNAVLVVKKMGDWKRYGLLPLQVTQLRVDQYHNSNEPSLSLTLSTLKGSHWDGQIHIMIERDENNLMIRSILVIPKSGGKISRKIALKIVEGLSQSVASSLRMRTRQSLARMSQSSRFKKNIQDRASERRRTRFAKEKDLEEMAEDRRRRWQRSNPNSGSYRPSGDRMKSPNNAMF